MFKKSLMVFSAVLYPLAVAAQGAEFAGVEEEIFISGGTETVSSNVYMKILPEVRYEEMQSFEVSQEVVPETVIVETIIEPVPVSATFGEFMVDAAGEMMKSAAPILASIEENKKLPQANDDMGAKVKQCMGKYPAEHRIEKDWNILTVSGKYEEEGSVVQYGILRNLSLAVIADDLYKGNLPTEAVVKIAENYIGKSGGKGLSLEGLDVSKISLDEMQVRKINGKEFAAIMDEENKEVYLLRNIGTYSVVGIQATGEKFKKLAREFVLSLDEKCIKSAVGDDGRGLESIRTEVNRKDNGQK